MYIATTHLWYTKVTIGIANDQHLSTTVKAYYFSYIYSHIHMYCICERVNMIFVKASLAGKHWLVNVLTSCGRCEDDSALVAHAAHNIFQRSAYKSMKSGQNNNINRSYSNKNIVNVLTRLFVVSDASPKSVSVGLSNAYMHIHIYNYWKQLRHARPQLIKKRKWKINNQKIDRHNGSSTKSCRSSTCICLLWQYQQDQQEQ